MSPGSPSPSIRLVKGFVVLAIVLLVPTFAYFQKQHFESRLQPRLRESVMETLKAEGVERPGASMEYLDAIIWGRVDREAERLAVAAKVDALPGLRLGPTGNRLQAYGWIRIERDGSEWRGAGLVPEDFRFPAPAGVEAGAEMTLEAVSRRWIVAPEGAEGWGSFLADYFEEQGNRSVELRQGSLVMRGDATVLSRGDWRALASDVVDRSQVVDEFTLHPSRYHFPGYRPESMEAGGRYEKLRDGLAAIAIQLHARPEEDEEVFVPEPEQAQVVELSKVILGAGDEVRYAVGGHPGSNGNVTAEGRLAKRRAEAIVRLLVENGVPEERLEAVSFGVTPGGERDNQVEVVVK